MIALNVISPKKVMKRKIRTYLPEDGETFLLYRVMGTVLSVIDKDTDFGISLCLGGDFKAISWADGGQKRFRSPACFLSQPIANMIKSHFYADGGEVSEVEVETKRGEKKKQELITGTKSVEIAFDVFIQEADTATGYEYVYESLQEIECTDPLMEMEERLELLAPPPIDDLNQGDKFRGAEEFESANKQPTPKKKARKKKAKR